MFFVNLLLLFTSIVCVSLGLMIIVSNPKRRENQTLFAFVMSVSLWLITNLLTNLSPSSELALQFGKSTFATAALVPLTFLIFTRVYLGHGFRGKYPVSWLVLPFILLMLSPTSLNIASIDAHGLNVVTGPAYYLLILEAVLYVTYALRLMYKSYKNNATPRIIKSQIRYIFIGFIAAFIPILMLNGLAPIFANSDTVILLGPNAVVLLVLFTSLSIIQHRLLDIRLIVVKVLGYLFSIGVIGLLYGFLAFNVVSEAVFQDTDLTIGQRAVYTILAVTIAFTFQPLKRFFDRWSNRFFYQDAYDGQALIDELNQALVSTIELNKMLKSSADILERNIKPEFCVFGLKETAYEGQRIIGDSQKKIGYQDVSFAKDVGPQKSDKVIVADYLEETHKALRAKMRKNDIAVLVRLTTDVDSDGIGVIALGAKKSGNTYNSQDMKVLEIVANSLVIAIDNALRFEEIQKFNITLEQKVEDATRKLRRANDKLIALDQTKDDFISMASHQLRTPLTSVKGYLSMVLEGDTGKVNAKQEKMLEQAFTSSQRMVYLIADLLNVSRLRTGKFVIESKPTNLAEVIEGEIGQLKTTAAGKNQKLTYDKPKNFPTLMIDETKIRQVIMNFTDNALHYTPNGGKIHVSLEEKPDTIQFTVTDNGIGIPRHEQHHLFTKFFRAGNARKARPDGTGLGLFMAKKVIIAQGGSIIFKSQEGKGSTFGFTFSKSRLKLPPAPKPAVDEKTLHTVR